MFLPKGEEIVVGQDPTVNLSLATKQYVDTKVGAYLPLAGGTLTGALSVSNPNDAIVFGPGTVKGRLMAGTAVPDVELTSNATRGGTQDDATKASWRVKCDSSGDSFQVNRQPVGSATPASMLAMNNASVLSIPGGAAGVGSPAVTLGSNSWKVRFQSNNAASTALGVISVNRDWATSTYDDATKPSWDQALGFNDTYTVRRAPAGTAGTTALLTVDGPTGKTTCTLADASVTKAMLAAGATVATFATAGAVPSSYSTTGMARNQWTTAIATTGSVTVKTGQYVMISVNAALFYVGANQQAIYLGLFRDGAIYIQWQYTVGGSTMPITSLPIAFPPVVWDTPAAGNHTYALSFFLSNTNGEIQTAANSNGVVNVMVFS